jgi:predicted permease
MLGKRPAFTLIAVLALALGIGANTAVFSVIRGVMLRPLPFLSPEKLVAIWESNLKGNAPQEASSPLNFKDWREQNRCFEDMAAMGGAQATLSGDGDAEVVVGSAVSTNFFNLIGVAPAMGRVFEAADLQNEVIVISDGFWTRRFGRSPNIIGRKVRFSQMTGTGQGSVQTIVGVMAPDFQPPNVDGLVQREFWRPLHAADLLSDPSTRRYDYLRVYARMRPGITFAQARVEMKSLTGRLADQYPADNRAWEIQVNSLADATAHNVKQPLWLLLGAAAMLLLTACANVANLCLARASERAREFAIRTALGGGAGRLVRQLLTESLTLGLIGGVAGLALGIATLRGMLLIGGQFLPRISDVRMDWTVMLFAFLVACATSVIFGILPARHAVQSGLSESLNKFSRGRAGSVLVAAEVALTLVLLIASGLLLRSFWSVQAVPLGFEPSHLLTAAVRLPGTPQDIVPAVRLLTDFLDRVERLPGVTSAGAISAAPLTGNGHNAFLIEGRPAPDQNTIQDAVLSVVSPGHFRTMGIALRRGRYPMSRASRRLRCHRSICRTSSFRYYE